MEFQCITMETPEPDNIEINLLKKDLLFNNKQFNLNMEKINEDTIKLIILNNSNGCDKYEGEYNFKNFQLLNKYFKMFNNFDELINDLIEIIQENNIEITNETDNEIFINVKVMSRKDNIVKLCLKKKELYEKDKIKILNYKFNKLQEMNDIKDKKIIELEKKISDILEDLAEKDKRIKNLEKEIVEIKNNKIAFNKLNNEIKKQNIDNLDKIQEDKIIIKDNNNFDNIIKDSNIFKNDEEIKFLLNNIFNKKKILK